MFRALQKSDLCCPNNNPVKSARIAINGEDRKAKIIVSSLRLLSQSKPEATFELVFCATLERLLALLTLFGLQNSSYVLPQQQLTNLSQFLLNYTSLIETLLCSECLTFFSQARTSKFTSDFILGFSNLGFETLTISALFHSHMYAVVFPIHILK